MNFITNGNLQQHQNTGNGPEDNGFLASGNIKFCIMLGGCMRCQRDCFDASETDGSVVAQISLRVYNTGTDLLLCFHVNRRTN